MGSCAIVRMSRPPTGNHSTTVANGRRILSNKYRAWKDAEVWSLKSQRQPKVEGAYSIHFQVNRPDNRKRDLGNLEKGLHDAIVQAGLVEDDSKCQRIVLEWVRGAAWEVKAFIVSTNER